MYILWGQDLISLLGPQTLPYPTNLVQEPPHLHVFVTFDINFHLLCFFVQNSRTPAEERQIRFAYDTHRFVGLLSCCDHCDHIKPLMTNSWILIVGCKVGLFQLVITAYRLTDLLHGQPTVDCGGPQNSVFIKFQRNGFNYMYIPVIHCR